MKHTVRFERHETDAVDMARRCLQRHYDAIEEDGGSPPVKMALALDDLANLSDRMKAEVATRSDRASVVEQSRGLNVRRPW